MAEVSCIILITLLTLVPLLKLSVLHMSLFKSDQFLNSIKTFIGFLKQRIKIKIYLVIASLFFETITLCIFFEKLGGISLILEKYSPSSITGTDTEIYTYIIVTLFNYLLEISKIPIICILGLSLIVREEFHNLQSEIYEAINSDHLYNSTEDIFGSFKQKCKDISNAVICIDNTFRYYIIVISFDIGVEVSSAIYHRYAGCTRSDMFPVSLMVNFCVFLVLCISGAILQDAVSKIRANIM